MTDVAALQEKIQRLKKTLTEKQQKEPGAKETIELRTFRKQLKRLQRRRRVLLAWTQRATKVKAEKAEKESKPAAKPAAAKAEPPAA